VRSDGDCAGGRERGRARPDGKLYWVGHLIDASSEKEARRLAAEEIRVLVEQIPAATYVEAKDEKEAST
jgi:hypothetical protein